MSLADKPAQSTTAGEPAKLDPAKTRQIQELKYSSPLIACRFDPTGRFVFASAQDSKIVRWELATLKQTVLAGHKSWVRGLAFLAKDKILFTGDYEGKVLAWPAEAESPQPLRTLEAHQGWVRAVAVSPDDEVLATCGNDHLVKLWSAANSKLRRELSGHTRHVYNLAFHPKEPFLLSADLMGVVKQWDLAQAKVTREFDASVLHKYDPTFRADIGGARSMAVSPDGAWLACSGMTDVTNAFAGIGKAGVVLFDWKTGQRKQLLRPKEDFTGQVWGVAFHPDGFLIGAGGGNGGALWFWRPDQGQAFFTLKLPNNARDLSLHPDGRRLAVPFFDGIVRLYDLAAPSPA